MKHFYVISNESKDVDRKVLGKVVDYLKQKQVTCTVRDASPARNDRYTNASEIPEDVDCILVIGGDGTMLAAARDMKDRNIPLLGINMGTLGYLAEVDCNHVTEAIDQCLLGNFVVENRMMLAGKIYRADGSVLEDDALNDVVVSRAGSICIVQYDIQVDGQLLKKYEADGMILSTPTGSTGYSLSAGGPIVAPNAALTVLTPICPHTLNTRSIVLGADSEIVISIGEGRKAGAMNVLVSFDGGNGTELRPGDRLVVRRSERSTAILKLKDVSFLEVLQRKMRDY